MWGWRYRQQSVIVAHNHIVADTRNCLVLLIRSHDACDGYMDSHSVLEEAIVPFFQSSGPIITPRADNELYANYAPPPDHGNRLKHSQASLRVANVRQRTATYPGVTCSWRATDEHHSSWCLAVGWKG